MKAEGMQVTEGPGMNRYLSSERWRKVQAGKYESPDGKYSAHKYRRQWVFWVRLPDLGDHKQWELRKFHAALADCQEHADRLERR